MRTAAFLAAIATGCGLSVVGVSTDNVDGGGGGGDSGSSQSTDGALQEAESSSSSSSSADARSDVGVSDAAPDSVALPKCRPADCPGHRCVADACGYYANCKGLHDNVMPALPSGIYDVQRADGAATFKVYCEMNADNGGWTLVGQSAAGAPAAEFGWHSKLGDVAMADKAYSLDAIGPGLVFTEVLVATGTRAAIRTAYRVKPPAGFPGAFTNSDANVQSITRLTNPDCGGDGDKPLMLSKMGRTQRIDTFYFRDVGGDDLFGLRRDGWQLNYTDDCPETGRVHKQQGMLFVR